MDSATPRRGPISIVALVLFLALTLAVGFLAGMITMPNVVSWYPHLIKPSFNPPNWLFGPVWTMLYLFMAVAVWRAWRIAGLGSAAVKFWFVQFAFNFAWSFIFFGAYQIALALGDIVVLDLLVFITTIAFWRIDRIAGLLMLPYLAWVGFATLLNAAIWHLNG